MAQKTLALLMSLLVLGCGASSEDSKAYPGPELPRSRLAVLRSYGVRVERLDGTVPPPCDSEYCSFLLAPGKRRLVVRYRTTTFEDTAAGNIDRVEESRSQSTRVIDLDVLPGREYQLMAGLNFAMNDWFVEVTERGASKSVFSDRIQHCPCEPE